MIDVAGEDHVLEELRGPLADLRHHRHVGERAVLPAEIDPKVPLRLAAGITLHLDARDVDPAAVRKRGNGGAASFGIEAPPVIAALDLSAVERAVRQGNAAMRTDVAKREGLAVPRPPHEDRLAQK